MCSYVFAHICDQELEHVYAHVLFMSMLRYASIGVAHNSAHMCVLMCSSWLPSCV